MTPKALRGWDNSLRALQWVLAGGILWALIDGVFVRDQPSTALADVPLSTEPISAPDASSIGLDELEPLWRRDLQQRLHDPPPPPSPPKTKTPEPPPPPRLPRLLATFVEDGASWGLFETTKGQARVLPENGTIDGFRIIRVSAGTTTLEQNGKRFEINVPRDKRQSASSQRGRR